MDIRRIKLEIFEGPLDLLLHLIQKNELDITSVSLSVITDQYLSYLDLMQELNIELASEFLVIAAELARLKSRSLLPGNDEELIGEEEESFDQAQLIDRLLRYQQFKQVAIALSNRHQLGVDLFKRAVLSADLNPTAKAHIPVRSEEPEKLTRLYRELASRRDRAAMHQVALENVSVRQKMIELLDLFQHGRAHSLRALIERAESRSQKVGVFLAVLELLRMRLFRLVPRNHETLGAGWDVVRHEQDSYDVSHYQEEFRP